MNYRIALMSAYIGTPGKNELKMTEGCRRKLETYGVDRFLFNESHRGLLESFVMPNNALKPNDSDKKRSKIRNWVDDIRFRQFMYPTEKVTRDRLIAKLPKMQFYKLLDKEYDYYIWMDSKFTLLDDWLDFVLGLISENGVHDLQVCFHSERNTIKQEYEYMRYYIMRKDRMLCSKYVLKDMYYQVSAYLHDADYMDNVLYEAGFLLFSKNILNHKLFLDEWYAHNYYYSIQDQLSLPYLLKKNNVEVYPLQHSVYKLPGTKYGYYD